MTKICLLFYSTISVDCFMHFLFFFFFFYIKSFWSSLKWDCYWDTSICKCTKKIENPFRENTFCIIPILIWFTHRDSLSTTLNSWLKFVNGVCYLLCCVISLIQKSFKQQKWSHCAPLWNDVAVIKTGHWLICVIIDYILINLRASRATAGNVNS